MDGVEAQLTGERDRAAKYIYGARAARDFADGFVAVLLPVYLAAIGLGALEIGLVAALALLSSASMTLASASSEPGSANARCSWPRPR